MNGEQGRMGMLVDLPGERAGGRGYLALPPAGGGPGVLVLHAWWGLTGPFMDLCDRLAGAGFVALAPDLYRGRTAGTIDAAEELLGRRDSEQMTADAIDAVALLRGHQAVRGGGLGAVGFSMGAAWAILLATECRPDDFAAVVIFYGSAEGDFARSRAAFLGHFAPGDEWEPDEGVAVLEAAIRAAGKEVTFHRYPGAGHWFFEVDRPDAYDPAAAELAWERTVAHLRRHLSRTGTPPAAGDGPDGPG